MTNQRWTKTSSFLLVCFMFSFTLLHSLGFMNAYLGLGGYDKPSANKLFLVFKKEYTKANEKQWATLTEPITSNPYYLETINYDEHHWVIVLDYPKEYLPEYRAFIKGKYSDFSPLYIERFFEDPNSVEYKACTKSQALKEYLEENLGVTLEDELEYWSIPDMKFEIFNYDTKIEEELLEYANLAVA